MEEEKRECAISPLRTQHDYGESGFNARLEAFREKYDDITEKIASDYIRVAKIVEGVVSNEV